jgi:hypothetical protein
VHDPPKANPGFKYAPDAFSLPSARKIRVTSRASAPSASQISPISFANATLTAWNAFETYFTISAVVIVVSMNGASVTVA